MAAMRKEPKDIAELGPIGIVREALKLYAAHFKVYFLIQLMLMLPLAILLLGVEYFLFGEYLTLPHGAPRFLRSFRYKVDFTGQVEAVLVTIAASLVFPAVVSLSHSTTLYSVGLHYAGRPVSFVDALSAVTPRLWMRLALTVVYVHVLAYSSIALQRFVESLFLRYVSSGVVLGVVSRSSAVECLSVVAGLGLGILLMMSSAVSVLEVDYGWAAMKKGLKLLKGKGIVAILFQVLWILPAIVEMCFGAAVVGKLGDTDVGLSPSALALLSVTVVAFLAWTTLFWEIGALCAGVQYVSFKAYHDESLSDSLYEKRTILVEGYERSGDKSNVALLKGALVKGNVV